MDIVCYSSIYGGVRQLVRMLAKMMFKTIYVLKMRAFWDVEREQSRWSRPEVQR
jgi:hypothetical protein